MKPTPEARREAMRLAQRRHVKKHRRITVYFSPQGDAALAALTAAGLSDRLAIEAAVIAAAQLKLQYNQSASI